MQYLSGRFACARNRLISVLVGVLGVLAIAGGALAEERAARRRPIPGFDCGYQSPDRVRAAIRDAVAKGLIADPRARPIPPVAQRSLPQLRGGGVPTVTVNDIFPHEDSASVLITNFTDGELFDLMIEASNALLTAHGDNFDFIGFFLNFVPDHQIGAAFYSGIENDVAGLGLPLFNDRAGLGLAGDNLEGWVMMWNQADWGPNDTTMLVLGQEVEHRWGMFLNDLLDGRPLQGNNAGCGRSAHWNWRVDGQGSGMEIREWIGAGPAVLGGDCAPGGFFFICFNSDIGDSPGGLGGVFSFPDLYLMGYASPAEMDAGASELRYMETSDCSSLYNGVISSFDSSDIIAANGARVPDSMNSQTDFRTGWIMLHLPGAPPTNQQLTNVADTLNLWSETWQWSTLNRGTMDNTLQLAFSIAFPAGTPTLLTPDSVTSFAVQTVNGSGMPDTGSGLLHFRIDGGPELTAPLAFLGGDSFQADIPAIACGSVVEYFVTIDAVGGGTIRAPGLEVPAITASVVPVDDDFEMDNGFTVSGGATDGQWSRGVPVGGGDRGDPPADFDGSGQSWLTDNIDGDSDVDGGTTILTSPIFDLTSVSDPFVSYARWYNNVAGSSPQADTFVVEVSDDAGGSWVELETVGPTLVSPNPEVAGGWFLRSFRVADFVGVSSQFQIRFSASDLGAGSIVEAGVDKLRIIDCAAVVPCPGHDGNVNGDPATNALDIQAFISEMLTPTGDSDTVCAGDFDDSGVIDPPDIMGMVNALLTAGP